MKVLPRQDFDEHEEQAQAELKEKLANGAPDKAGRRKLINNLAITTDLGTAIKNLVSKLTDIH